MFNPVLPTNKNDRIILDKEIRFFFNLFTKSLLSGKLPSVFLPELKDLPRGNMGISWLHEVCTQAMAENIQWLIGYCKLEKVVWTLDLFWV